MKSLSRFTSNAVFAMALLAAGVSAHAGPVVINFDDHDALSCFSGGGCFEGRSVPAEDVVTTDYLAQGVTFSSPGGGIAILAGSNPISAPNGAAGMGAGSVIDYYALVTASFTQLVNTVSVTLSSTSTGASLQAFDSNGALLQSTAGGTSSTLSVFASNIKSVTITPNYAAFDNFTFAAQAVPEPSSALLLAGGLFVLLRLSRRQRAEG